jgi:hypothetical protein
MAAIWTAFVLIILSSLVAGHDHCPSYSFGTCTNPSIYFGWNISGSRAWGYQPSNGHDFPHGCSPDIATIESFICNRLESPCNAPPDTVNACRNAFNTLSGLSGDNAINAWNAAMGLGGDGSDDGCSYSTASYDDYATTTTMTMYSVSTGYSLLTTITSTTVTSTETDYVTSTISPSSEGSILTVVTFLPATTKAQQDSTFTQTATYVTLTTTTSSVSATAPSAVSTTTAAPQSQSGDQDGDGGGGSPFDGGASKEVAGGILVVAVTIAVCLYMF